VVAAAVVAAAGAGWWARERIRALETERADLARRVEAYRDTVALVRGPHTRSVTIPVTTGGRLGWVTIFEDSVAHRWLVRCENLAPNEPDQAYQLWFVTDAGLQPALLLTIDRAEPTMALLDVPRERTAALGAAMSIEPRAGSPEMTGPQVFRQMP
jgi:hypothetical protein